MTETRERLRLGTWNMLRDRPEGIVRGQLQELLDDQPGLHALALQEVRDYHDQLRKVDGYQWHGTTEGPRGADQNGVLVREDVSAGGGRWLDLGGDGWTTVDGHHHVGSVAYGVKLEGWLRVYSLHMPVSVQWRHGRPTGPPERVDDYKANMRRLLMLRQQYHPNARSGLTMVRQRPRYGSDHPLVVFTVSRVDGRHGLAYVGDWNCTPGKDEGRFSVSWLGQHADMAVGKAANAQGHLAGVDLALVAR